MFVAFAFVLSVVCWGVQCSVVLCCVGLICCVL